MKRARTPPFVLLAAPLPTMVPTATATEEEEVGRGPL